MASSEIRGVIINAAAEAIVKPLVPIIKAALPEPPPTPGDPRGIGWVMEETSRLQGRGDGSERPENEGDLSPDHGPNRRDIAPIEAPDAHDEGGAVEVEVGELIATLQVPVPPPKPLIGSHGEVAEWRGLDKPQVSLKALEATWEAKKKRKKQS